MRRLVRQARGCRSLSHPPIQPRNGPARCEGQLSSPMRTITSSTSSSASSWMSKPAVPFAMAEDGAAKTMIERTEERFEIKPAYLAADTAYGSADTLNWIVNEKKIAPHIPVIGKSKREDGTFSREDFRFD